MTSITFVGAVYIDTILTVPKFPVEDEKLRAISQTRRRGGNCANTLEVISQLIFENDNDNYAESNVSSVTHFSTADSKLYLMAVLPISTSNDVAFIKRSLSRVQISDSCIFRRDHSDAAASYIIQNAANNTRTIVSHNPLPEMRLEEFMNACQRSDSTVPRSGWYHFEGRIPDVLLPCVEYLRSRCKEVAIKISVECEKPERVKMINVARHANVVFFSKLWAQKTGFDNPIDFLQSIKGEMRDDALLCCTWGEKGAAMLQKHAHSDVEQVQVPGWAPGTERQVVDTIGAGDTFVAGMLYALTSHADDWSLQRKLGFANELAGRKVYQDGFAGLGTQIRLAMKSD